MKISRAYLRKIILEQMIVNDEIDAITEEILTKLNIDTGSMVGATIRQALREKFSVNPDLVPQAQKALEGDMIGMLTFVANLDIEL